MTMTKNLRNALCVATAALALSACVSFGGKAPPSMLVLTSDSSVAGGTSKSGASGEALIVLLPETPRKLDTNRVPVQVDDSNIAYLETPGLNLQLTTDGGSTYTSSAMVPADAALISVSGVATGTDAGTYTCVATSTAGTVTSTPATASSRSSR